MATSVKTVADVATLNGLTRQEYMDKLISSMAEFNSGQKNIKNYNPNVLIPKISNYEMKISQKTKQISRKQIDEFLSHISNYNGIYDKQFIMINGKNAKEFLEDKFIPFEGEQVSKRLTYKGNLPTKIETYKQFYDNVIKGQKLESLSPIKTKRGADQPQDLTPRNQGYGKEFNKHLNENPAAFDKIVNTLEQLYPNIRILKKSGDFVSPEGSPL